MQRKSKENDKKKKLSLSYWSKTKVTCPCCRKDFAREELLSGGGRLIAGGLTEELQRLYEPSAKYGQVYPVIYAVGACPMCHAAFFWSDFAEITDKPSVDALRYDEDARKKSVEAVFPYYDVSRERTLLDGAAMYYLALLSYEKVDICYAPTVKKGIICLRLAWLCQELEKVVPGHNYDWMAKVFYQKAGFFYEQTIINESNGSESITVVNNFGPDVDKNYGYDGVIYLASLLEYKYGQRDDIPGRLKKLDANKRSIARIFGLGKSSKAKPGPLLEHSRNLYDNLTAELSEANTIDFEDEEEVQE